MRLGMNVCICMCVCVFGKCHVSIPKLKHTLKGSEDKFDLATFFDLQLT